MTAPGTTRSRPTETIREGSRLTRSLALTLGRTVRDARRALHLTQAALGERVGVHQTWISRIELGRGAAAPLDLWATLGVALDRPIAVSFSRPTRLLETSDAGHLAIQEYLLGLARDTGRTGGFELPTRPTDPARSTDVVLRDDRHDAMILIEAWNTFGDLGAAVRATHRKAAEVEAAGIARSAPDRPPSRVATVWVVRSSAANRALLARYPHVVDAAFPGSSRAWLRALIDGADPPHAPGFVWFDPSTPRLTERRAHGDRRATDL